MGRRRRAKYHRLLGASGSNTAHNIALCIIRRLHESAVAAHQLLLLPPWSQLWKARDGMRMRRGSGGKRLDHHTRPRNMGTRGLGLQLMLCECTRGGHGPSVVGSIIIHRGRSRGIVLARECCRQHSGNFELFPTKICKS